MSLPKPDSPVLNPLHLFASGLVIVVPFTEGTGLPAILLGPAAPSGVLPDTLTVDGFGASPAWTTNAEGTAIGLPAAAYFIDAVLGADWLKPSTAGVTICLIRRKTDAANRAAIAYGTNDTGTGRLCLLCPYNDGTVYWDYGGDSGANRLSVPSLTFSTDIEHFVFTAGPAGLTMWRDGVQVGSSGSNPGVATAQNVNIGINTPVFGTQRDEIELNYLAVYATQWDDDTAEAWFADPYAHLYAPPPGEVTFTNAGLTTGLTWLELTRPSEMS